MNSPLALAQLRDGSDIPGKLGSVHSLEEGSDSMRLLRLRNFLVLACACAALTASPAAAITGGQLDGNAHPYVAFIGDPNPPRPFCSGVVIDSTTVVTAAHCFATPGQFVLVFPDGPAASAPVPGFWFPDPEFCAACSNGLVGFATHDIAIVKLMVPLQLTRYAQLPALGASEQLGNQAPLTTVGYGVQEFVKAGPGKPQPVTNFMRTWAGSELGTAGTKLADEFLKVKLNHGGFCLGDSGGPALMGDTVLAINSFLTNEGCNGVGYAYRLDTAEAQSFIAAN